MPTKPLPTTAMAAEVLPLRDGYSYADLLPLLEAVLKTRVSVLLRGHPGVGKSALAREVATRLRLPLIDIRLAHRDPAEIAGVYHPDRERKVLSLYPPDWVQEACAEPRFIFLDEINAAVTRLHQAVAYQIVLERRIGPCVFHPDTLIVAAGNLEGDNALVTSLSAPLNNRFAHFDLRIDTDAWLTWAGTQRLDPLVVAFIRQHGATVLYDNTGEPAFPTPRSWEMASRALASVPVALQKRAVAACVGARTAEKLFVFRRLYRRIDPKAIMTAGRIPNFTRSASADPSFIHAAVFALAEHVCRERIPATRELPNLVAFMRAPGLDVEYVILLLKHLRQHGHVFDRLKKIETFHTLAAELVDRRPDLIAPDASAAGVEATS